MCQSTITNWLDPEPGIVDVLNNFYAVLGLTLRKNQLDIIRKIEIHIFKIY